MKPKIVDKNQLKFDFGGPERPDSNSDTTKNTKKTASHTISNYMTTINNNLETLLHNTQELQRDVNFLKDKYSKVMDEPDDTFIKAALSELPSINKKEDNSEYGSSELFKTIVSIYNSPNIKKSLSLNAELIGQVTKLIKENFKFVDTDSKAINTALLIALLKLK